MKTFSAHFIISFIGALLLLKAEVLPLPYNAVSAVVVFLGFWVVCWLSAFFYHRSYFRKLPKAVLLVLYFLRQLLIANLRIAYDIVTPHYDLKPAVIALPLSVKTDREITLLAILITLTPGTLSIDVREDKAVLFVHALYVDQQHLDQLKTKLKQGFERRIMELTA